MKTSKTGLELIKHYESTHDGDLSKIGLQPKKDPIGILTVGWGHALSRLDGTWIDNLEEANRLFPQYMNIDEQTAEKLLYEDLVSRENAVNSLGLILNQSQFDALVSLIYNIGFNNFQTSTVLRRIRAKAEPFMIYDAFLMWNKAGGKALRGLTYRRQSEATLFNTGQLKFYN